MAFSPSTLNNAAGRAGLSGGNVGRRLIRCIAWACLMTSAFAVCLPAGASSAVLDDARRLIGEGRAADAYRLLAASELALAGRPAYDYLFGVAALDSGRPAEAIAAFQRVLARDPGAASARLELGRAYFEAGDRAAARRHFAALLARQPPPAIRAVAEDYLRAIDQPAARASGWNGGYEFGTGIDSNANAATGDDSFLGVTLDPHSVRTSSAYLQLAGWLGHELAVGQHGALVTQARAGHRWNPDAGFVDQSIASLDATLRLGDGPTVFSIGAGAYYGWLDGDPHRWGANVDLALSHRIGDGWRATGLLRAGKLRYDDSAGLSVLDVDQQLVALSLQRTAAPADFAVTVFAGDEDPDQPGSAFGNDRVGVILQAGSRTAAGRGLRLQLGYQSIDYDDTPGFFFGTDRQDDFWFAAFSGEVRDWPTPGFELVPRIGWSRNESNISLYEYDRLEIGLTLRRSFR